MSAYTVSRLALDAGGERAYRARLPAARIATAGRGTATAYGLFDDTALQRLRLYGLPSEAGIGLDALARLCRALDAADVTVRLRSLPCCGNSSSVGARPGQNATGRHANRTGTARESLP